MKIDNILLLTKKYLKSGLKPQILKEENGLLKVCYVRATSTSLPRHFSAAAINSSNETNKAGRRCYQPVYITLMSMNKK
jgi:hypothetical protein